MVHHRQRTLQNKVSARCLPLRIHDDAVQGEGVEQCNEVLEALLVALHGERKTGHRKMDGVRYVRPPAMFGIRNH